MGQKKRKRPHHQPRRHNNKNEVTPFSFPRPESNSRGAITAVPRFAEGSPQNNIDRSPLGLPGTYSVTYILSVSGRDTFLSELKGDQFVSAGTSLLAVPPGAKDIELELYNDLEKAHIVITSNKDGLLSQVKMRVRGENFTDVQKFSHDLIHPVLSMLSFQYDVSLDVQACEILEEATSVRRYVFGMIGKVKAMDSVPNGNWISTPKFRMVFSAYREGLNATNVFYQVLSFYRVIEGVRGIRRQRRQGTISAGGEWRDPRERIPETFEELPPNPTWVNESFKDYLGKKFTVVLDGFREVFRNAIAHLDPEQEVMLGDRFDDVTKCEKAIPVIKYIAREMLMEEMRNDLELDGQNLET